MGAFDPEKTVVIQPESMKFRRNFESDPQMLPLGKRFYTIGRSKDCDIVLPHRNVSAKHALIEIKKSPKGIKLRILDLRSETGVYVDDFKVNESTISPGQKIQISIYAIQIFERNNHLYYKSSESWEQYRIEAKGATFKVGNKTILDNVSLVIHTGEFVGLFGPSGSGKTTLLKLLSGYSRPTSGGIFIGGMSLQDNFDFLKERIGYTPQDDIIYKDLTVRESLFYAASLRLPPETTKKDLNEVVTETLGQLDLLNLQHQTVSSLSGGQRKRVSIGVELLTRPHILMMDEPDAGLDPHIQDQLMDEFRKLADSGSSVIMTTHTLDNFPKFDHVAIISMGELTFFGPPKEAIRFFNAGKGDIREPRHIFRRLDSRKHNDPQYRKKLARHYANLFRKGICYKELVENRTTTSTPPGVPSENTFQRILKSFIPHKFIRNVSKPWRLFTDFEYKKLFTLITRHIQLHIGSWKSVSLHLLIPFIVLGILSFQEIMPTDEQNDIAAQQKTYWQNIEKEKSTDSKAEEKTSETAPKPVANSPDGTANPTGIRNGIPGNPPVMKLSVDANRMLLRPKIPHIFPLIMVLTAIFCGTFISCTEISRERNIYIREHLVCVDILPYLLSKLPVLFGITFIQMSILMCFTVIMKNLEGVPVIPGIITLTLVSWASVTLGLFLSTLDRTGQSAMILSIGVIIPQIIWSGAIAPNFYEKMHAIPKLISNILPSRWGFEGMATVFNHKAVIEWGPKLVQYQLGFAPRTTSFNDPLFGVHVPLLILSLILFLFTWISLKIQDSLN